MKKTMALMAAFLIAAAAGCSKVDETPTGEIPTMSDTTVTQADDAASQQAETSQSAAADTTDTSLSDSTDKPAFNISAVTGVFKSQVNGERLEIKTDGTWRSFDEEGNVLSEGTVGESSDEIGGTVLWYYALMDGSGATAYSFINDGSDYVTQFDAGNGGVDLWDRVDDDIYGDDTGAPDENEVPDETIDEGGSVYIGNFYEEIAGRGYMTITENGSGYHIQCNWSSSAAEMAAWDIDAIYNSDTGDLTYSDGTYKNILFDEEGNDTVTEERTVSGVLSMNDEGTKLLWTDNAFDENPEPSTFVKE
jgi:hypothetical protein